MGEKIGRHGWQGWGALRPSVLKGNSLGILGEREPEWMHHLLNFILRILLRFGDGPFCQSWRNRACLLIQPNTPEQSSSTVAGVKSCLRCSNMRTKQKKQKSIHETVKLEIRGSLFIAQTND